jgi:hypothetical protein
MGPRFSDVETFKNVGKIGTKLWAQWGTPFQSWKKPATRKHLTNIQRFNGARLFRTWKLYVGHINEFGYRGFMGPPPFLTGNLGTGISANCPVMLQWGHAFSDVETSQSPP